MSDIKPIDASEFRRRLILRFAHQTEDVRRHVEGLHENLVARRIVPDRWSLKELLCHIRRIQQVYMTDRLAVILKEDNPELTAYQPDNDPHFAAMLDQPSAENLTSFMEERLALIARLEELPPADWLRPARHPIYPDSDLQSLTEYLALHEAHHIYQMFQRRALLGKLS
ncbi:MAG: DinB family protein [Vicinamibacteria bacterium]|nr:DinB family protein [Vicinamibacteria bacterium]